MKTDETPPRKGFNDPAASLSEMVDRIDHLLIAEEMSSSGPNLEIVAMLQHSLRIYGGLGIIYALRTDAKTHEEPLRIATVQEKIRVLQLRLEQYTIRSGLATG